MDGIPAAGIPLFTLVIYLVVVSNNITHTVSSNYCNYDYATFGSKQKGHLLGYVSNLYNDTRSLVDCTTLCGRHINCVSVNYDLESGNCELNTQTIALVQSEEFALNDNMMYLELLPMWHQWGPWGSCSQTCDDGTEERSRDCCGPGSNPVCVGDNMELRPCNLGFSCPVWGDWGAWGSCSSICGRSRSRVCVDIDGIGDPCPGSATESGECNIDSCYYRGCSGTYTDFAATFGLTSYSNSYSCTWNIQVEAGKRIELKFVSLNTESCCDHVRLFLGHSSPKFSGSSTPSGTFVSSSNTMTVTFKSDYSITKNGFVLLYKTVV